MHPSTRSNVPSSLRRVIGAVAAVIAFAGGLPATALAVQPSVLYNFPTKYANSYATGRLAQGGDGRIFIATTDSLYMTCGELLALNPINGKVSKVALDRTAIGCNPSENLALDGQGALWATTASKGPGKRGALFRIPSGGAPTTAHAFTKAESYSGGTTPAPWPDGSVRLSRSVSSQSFYGQVERYGPPVFAPELLTLVTAADGITSPNGLATRGDGYLYGSAINISGEQYSSIFRVDAAGVLTVLVELYPYGVFNGELIDGRDGFFYASTNDGGPANQGNVLKISPTGATTVLHSFSGSDGAKPTSAPMRASDGRLYGTTAVGGASNLGVIYRLRTDGSGYEVLFSFDGGTLGSAPRSGLLQASDGRLYGRNIAGGAASQGVLYRFDLPAQ